MLNMKVLTSDNSYKLYISLTRHHFWIVQRVWMEIISGRIYYFSCVFSIDSSKYFRVQKDHPQWTNLGPQAFAPLINYRPIAVQPDHLIVQIERRNSKGRSGYTFGLILQKTFAVFSHQKLKVAQIWSTHQSKALIFYFGMKKFWVGFLKILWETDKLNFIFWNLRCVYTLTKFELVKCTLSISHKIFKNPVQNFFRTK